MWCWLHWSALWEKGLQRPLRCARPCPISVRLDCSGDRNRSDRCHLRGGPLYHKVSNHTWASPKLRAALVPPFDSEPLGGLTVAIHSPWVLAPPRENISVATWARHGFSYRTGTTYFTHFYIKMNIVYVLRLFSSLTENVHIFFNTLFSVKGHFSFKLWSTNFTYQNRSAQSDNSCYIRCRNASILALINHISFPSRTFGHHQC